MGIDYWPGMCGEGFTKPLEKKNQREGYGKQRQILGASLHGGTENVSLNSAR